MAAFSLFTPTPKVLTLALPSSSPLLFSKPTSFLPLSYLSSPSTHLKLTKGRGLGIGFVRKVAVSSEYNEVVSEEDEGPASFSEDLKLFVGNLPFSVESEELAALFGSEGTVERVEVIYDKTTGRSRGFAFVTMSTVEEVEAAAQKFNGYEIQGRALRVNSGPPPPRELNILLQGKEVMIKKNNSNSGKEIKVLAQYIHMSALKARRVIDQIRGRSYEEALMILELMPYRASYPILKLVLSAAANASHNMALNEADSFINKAEVNEGPFVKKLRPRARGRSYAIKKATCHITIVLKENSK